MKKFLSLLVMLCLVLKPCLASDQAPPTSDYKANSHRMSNPPLGYGSNAATDQAISMSMMGWGLGIIIAIVALSTLITQSTFAHADQAAAAADDNTKK